MVARKGGSPSSSSSAPSSSSNADSGSSNADSGPSSDSGDSNAGMVCSPLKAGRHPKTRQNKSMFKLSSEFSPRTENVSSQADDSLAERLGALMLLGKGKATETGRVKRFSRGKGRTSLLRRAKRPPPALSWDQVEPLPAAPSLLVHLRKSYRGLFERCNRCRRRPLRG
ncbi:hypothetical protein T484DRAFT_1898190 [Baffinella frigidus]|nr:hypothetical protein T484DRAFT_1898190 [Cryptophyta sp. CCMP2293]